VAGSLCLYITRPALSDERIQVNAAGQVQLELKTPSRDGTTHLVLSPLEFMQRLAALVPRPSLLVSRDRYRHERLEHGARVRCIARRFVAGRLGLHDPAPLQIRIDPVMQRDRSHRHARLPAFGNDLGLELLAVSSPAVPAVTQIRLRSVHVSI
jgi:hypothetical protein